MVSHDPLLYQKVIGMFQLLRHTDMQMVITGDSVEIGRSGRRALRLPLAIFYRLEPVEIIEMIQRQEGDTGGTSKIITRITR